jgi:hypothetical protein
LGSAIPIANQYASQWLYCDAFALPIDTGKIVRALAIPAKVPEAAPPTDTLRNGLDNRPDRWRLDRPAL